MLMAGCFYSKSWHSSHVWWGFLRFRNNAYHIHSASHAPQWRLLSIAPIMFPLSSSELGDVSGASTVFFRRCKHSSGSRLREMLHLVNHHRSCGSKAMMRDEEYLHRRCGDTHARKSSTREERLPNEVRSILTPRGRHPGFTPQNSTHARRLGRSERDCHVRGDSELSRIGATRLARPFHHQLLIHSRWSERHQIAEGVSMMLSAVGQGIQVGRGP